MIKRFRWTFEVQYKEFKILPIEVKLNAISAMNAKEFSIEVLCDKNNKHESLFELLGEFHHDFEINKEFNKDDSSGVLILYLDAGLIPDPDISTLEPIETWTLKGLFPKSFNLGNLDFSSNEEVVWCYESIEYKSFM